MKRDFKKEMQLYKLEIDERFMNIKEKSQKEKRDKEGKKYK